MNISTDILTVLVTVAMGVMGINMYVMRALWEDIKSVKREQAEAREEIATKADIIKYCEPKHDGLRKDANEQFCRKVDEIKKSIEELWNRMNHHTHEKETGRVVL